MYTSICSQEEFHLLSLQEESPSFLLHKEAKNEWTGGERPAKGNNVQQVSHIQRGEKLFGVAWASMSNGERNGDKKSFHSHHLAYHRLARDLAFDFDFESRVTVKRWMMEQATEDGWSHAAES